MKITEIIQVSRQIIKSRFHILLVLWSEEKTSRAMAYNWNDKTLQNVHATKCLISDKFVLDSHTYKQM